ncbi:hypothetical protein NDU88_001294 [Pleurodeles waltl]|uniref:Uncharacterized protein n=1 Tax=Pleurodeles waltl TaxID=8319 RepID=A0AAV7UUC8_PLEWA|nr:hypothetical protein NDU88_001294 [Pleurodeles waltl]
MSFLYFCDSRPYSARKGVLLRFLCLSDACKPEEAVSSGFAVSLNISDSARLSLLRDAVPEGRMSFLYFCDSRPYSARKGVLLRFLCLSDARKPEEAVSSGFAVSLNISDSARLSLLPDAVPEGRSITQDH